MQLLAQIAVKDKKKVNDQRRINKMDLSVIKAAEIKMA